MRRILYILGALFLVILVTGAVAFVVIDYKGRALDAESKAYVDAAIPAITKNWNEAELLNRATPELRNSTPRDQLDLLFSTFRRLGHLVQYRGSVGQSGMSYVVGKGETISASYIAKAAFQNGNVIFNIALLKRNGQWLINSLHVDLDPTAPIAQHQTAT